jgi:hypothetical protein
MIIMMIFNMSTSYLSQNFISLIRGLFDDEIDIRVKYLILNKCSNFLSIYTFNQNIEHLSSIWVAFNGYITSIELDLYIDTRTQTNSGAAN